MSIDKRRNDIWRRTWLLRGEAGRPYERGITLATLAMDAAVLGFPPTDYPLAAAALAVAYRNRSELMTSLNSMHAKKPDLMALLTGATNESFFIMTLAAPVLALGAGVYAKQQYSSLVGAGVMVAAYEAFT